MREALVWRDFTCKAIKPFPDRVLWWETEPNSVFEQFEVRLGQAVAFESDYGPVVPLKVLRGNQRYTGKIDVVIPTNILKRSGLEYAVVLREMAPGVDVQTVRLWLEKCSAEHKHVWPATKDLALESLLFIKAFRLVNVHTGDVCVMQRLERYIALLYVWGQSPSCQKFIVDQDGRSRIDWSSVSRVVQDAVDLVRRLDETYLWVDTLCIDQADSADKAANIRAMSAIYSNSCLTIVAATGPNAGVGLTRLHPDLSVQEVMVTV